MSDAPRPPRPGLRLRPIAPEDLDDLVALDRDPEVMRFITGGLPTPRALYERLLLGRLIAHADDDRGRGYFAIIDADAVPKDRFLGWAHLRPDSEEPTWLELGYRLHRRSWGEGIATWAASLLLRRGLTDPTVPVISARTTVDNLASQRVMEKLGLRRSGTFTFPSVTHPELSIAAAPAVLYTLDADALRRELR